MPFRLVQWDENACEAACTAQLLYMHGLLEPDFDRAVFDRKIRRMAGQQDVSAGCLELVLECGFEVVQFSPYNPQRTIADIDYVRNCLLALGYTREQVTAYLSPEMYAKLQTSFRNLLRLQAKYAAQLRVTESKPTYAGARDLLDAGYALTCNIRAKQVVVSHQVLLAPVESHIPDDVLQYDPGNGVVGKRRFSSELMSQTTGTLTAFRFG